MGKLWCFLKTICILVVMCTGFSGLASLDSVRLSGHQRCNDATAGGYSKQINDFQCGVNNFLSMIGEPWMLQHPTVLYSLPPQQGDCLSPPTPEPGDLGTGKPKPHARLPELMSPTSPTRSSWSPSSGRRA